MATTTDLKSVARKGLRVRVPPSPPFLMHQITNVISPNKQTLQLLPLRVERMSEAQRSSPSALGGNLALIKS